MAEICIFGGSFNPVHYGHLGLAEWVLRHTSINEIWMMVSPNNPLKDKRVLKDETQRLQELKEALSHVGENGMSQSGRACIRMEDDTCKYIVASDFEFSLPRPNYTANTLRELQQHYPEHQFSLLIGEDNYRLFEKWREWQFIVENFSLWVYPRHRVAQEENMENAPFHRTFPNVKFLSDAPYFDISSTEIRSQQNDGERVG